MAARVLENLVVTSFDQFSVFPDYQYLYQLSADELACRLQSEDCVEAILAEYQIAKVFYFVERFRLRYH